MAVHAMCPRTAVAVSSGLLGGIAAAVIIVILALIVGFFVYKRQSDSKRRKLIDDYSSQLQMVGSIARTHPPGSRRPSGR